MEYKTLSIKGTILTREPIRKLFGKISSRL